MSRSSRSRSYARQKNRRASGYKKYSHRRRRAFERSTGVEAQRYQFGNERYDPQPKIHIEDERLFRK